MILQIRELLHAMPDGVASVSDVEDKFTCHLMKTSWILDQSVTERPCYLIADEYIKIVKFIMLRCVYFFYYFIYLSRKDR